MKTAWVYMDSGNGHGRDRIFYNGRIHTTDDALPLVSVLGISGGRVVHAGNDRREAAARLASGAEAVDLHGLTVTPGLIDSHQHFIMQGCQLVEMDCRRLSRDDIVREVARRAAIMAPGEWILGRGWNHEHWPGRQWPSKEELDRAAPDNPVALTRLDGHSMWVNSVALRAGGIGCGTPDFPGGEILRMPDGEPRGILVDTPIFKVRAAIPPMTGEQKRDACLRAQEEMFRYGITSVGDAWQVPEDHEFLKSLYEAGSLRIRIYGMLASRFKGGQPCPGVDAAPVEGLFDDRLSLRAFKVVLDGSLGSRSAWLTEEYADRPGHKGNNRYSDELLLGVLDSAISKGFQTCTHAIGDAAVLQILNALEILHKKYEDRWLPHRIEHFQIAAPETVARALAIGVIPAMQSIHAAADREMAQARLGPAALAASYSWREVLNRGGIIANGSDSPMDGVNPFHGFHAAISRTAFAGRDTPPDRLRMTRAEALKSYTLWAAQSELAGGRKGSLTPGKWADFTVLDRDIMACPVDEIPDTRPLMTVVAGETVYGGM